MNNQSYATVACNISNEAVINSKPDWCILYEFIMKSATPEIFKCVEDHPPNFTKFSISSLHHTFSLFDWAQLCSMF